MGIRKSVGKHKRSKRPATAIAVKRDEAVRRTGNAGSKVSSARRDARYGRPGPIAGTDTRPPAGEGAP